MRLTFTRPLRLHPASSLVPDMRPSEYRELLADIREHGIREPLVVRGSVVLDGRHRLRAARELGLEHVPVREADLGGETETAFIIKSATLRRHLSDDQRAAMAAMWKQVAKGKPGRPAHGENAHSGVRESLKDSAREAACRTFNVSRRKVDEATQVLHVRPRLLQRVRSGDLKLKAALRDLRHTDRLRRARDLAPPEGKFSVIVLDPPWPYDRQPADEGLRGQCPYDPMSMGELRALEIPAADDCVMWLWVTNAKMGEAHQLLDAWGFRPMTILTWVKNRIGLGRWLRNRTEHCVLAVRGRPVVRLKAQSTVLYADIREHSRKPEEFFAMVDGLCVGPKLEMFARCRREGWESHGIEVGKFPAVTETGRARRRERRA